MDACRAINEIVFALMFVVAVGLGPFAGVMALFIHNLGVFAKLFSEAVEAIDPRPVEGIRATGARRLQEVIFGVIPQVLPLWSSLTLYRLETNVRSATTLGIVGAGGIGQTLYESIRAFHYAETAAQVIIVVATVMAIDPRPVEGIRATGARRLQEVIFGVVPQVMPLWSSLTLYRLETNVRSATTLGIVGAGGIGQTLYESIRSFQYGQTAAQVIIVVATIMVIDLFSARLRKTLV